jgi:FAD synthetase
MSLETLASRYIVSTEKVLKEMRRVEGSITMNEECVDNVLGYVTTYLADAKYYKAQKRFETSLTSIAYCEGLLDALKLLGAVKFEWPTSGKSEE